VYTTQYIPSRSFLGLWRDRIGKIPIRLQSIPKWPWGRSVAESLCMSKCIVVMLCFVLSSFAQTQVDYVGGTTAEVRLGASGRIELNDDRYLAFYADKSQMRIPYARVNLLEYGQQVDRRLALAVVVSPMFLLSKSRRHFLTVGYTDERGTQQAMVFRVDKNSIRAALVALEARTGLNIHYQDQEARKAGN
jgi:hypothetical protein